MKRTNVEHWWLSIFASLVFMANAPFAARAVEVSPAEARAIAREAYMYGLPLVIHYKEVYFNAVCRECPEFRAPFNQVKSLARVATPEDKTIVAPNSDTPYSFAWLDLRAEPVVLTTPQVEQGRYFSVQLIDVYGHNSGYLGTRATGNAAGKFLIAGPEWNGKAPEGISRVIRSETQFVLAYYRTQLFRPDDLENVKKIQAGYKVQTLSRYVGIAAPPAAPELVFRAWNEKKSQGLKFFEYLDFMLRLCPVHPSERALRERFASIGIGGGTPIDTGSLSPEMKGALAGGMAEMRAAIQKKIEADMPFINAALLSADTFGSREQLEAAARRWCLKDFYFLRAAGAIYGIDGNSAEEAIYLTYLQDSENQPLNEGKFRYKMRLPAGSKPLPANAFWSVTMYDGATLLLVANPINRYLINAPILPSLKRDPDGGLTLYIQHDSPGKYEESNWLPAPNGPFMMYLRLYLPDPEVMEHKWKPPLMERVK